MLDRTHAIAFLLMVLASGCSDEAEEQAVHIRFDVRVQGEAFECNGEYPDVGSPPSPYQLTDARFYVHGVELLDDSGKRYPVSLDDTAFQGRGVALLDFEDGCGDDGTPETNSLVSGRAEPGEYTGVRFTLGVPARENFKNLTAQPAPLNVTGMFWVWQSGYKYLKVDGFAPNHDGSILPYFLHLGASGCPGTNPNAPPTGDCASPNRVTYELSGFAPETSVVVADVAQLFAENDLAVNTADTAPGCMSEPDDPECSPLYARLGLDDPSQQVFFHLE